MEVLVEESEGSGYNTEEDFHRYGSKEPAANAEDFEQEAAALMAMQVAAGSGDLNESELADMHQAMAQPLSPTPSLNRRHKEKMPELRRPEAALEFFSGPLRDMSIPFAPVPLSRLLKHLADACEEGEDADVFGQGDALQAFEAEVAELLGKKGGLFFSNGMLASVVALRSHGARRVVLHPTSRLIHGEGEGLSSASTQNPQKTAGSARRPSTSGYAAPHGSPAQSPYGSYASERDNPRGTGITSAVLSAQHLLPEDLQVDFAGDFDSRLGMMDVQDLALQRRECLFVELPQHMNGGATVPFRQVQGMSMAVKQAGAKCHLEGTRLFEVQPFYDIPLAKLCAPFDSVAISFRESCGTTNGGTVLVGSHNFIEEARSWRGRLCGVPDSFTPQWLHCRQSMQATIDGFELRLYKLRKIVSQLSQEPSLKGLMRFDPPVPEACFIHVYLKGEESALEAAHLHTMTQCGLRLWDRLRGPGHSEQGEYFFDWNLGDDNASIAPEDVLAAWRAFSAECTSQAR